MDACVGHTEFLHQSHVEADGNVGEESIDRHEGEGARVGEGIGEGSLQVS